MSGRKIERRTFLKSCSAVAVAALPTTTFADKLAGVTATAYAPVSGRSKVRPMIGTGWRGHMFPGAVAPFGLVQLSPDTSGPPDPSWNEQGNWYVWQHCSGYHYGDNVINGFSHTHIQGTGGIDLGDILIMPLVDGKNWSWDTGKVSSFTEMQIEALGQNSGTVFAPAELGYRSFFSHDTEHAQAGYYRVHLDTPNVQAELTSTIRCGMHRYRFPTLPAEIRQGFILDLAYGLNCQVYEAEVTFESSTCLVGHRATKGWAADRHIYFVVEFSQPAVTLEISVDGGVRNANLGARYTGKEIKTILHHALSVQPVMIRVGISPTSIEGAKKNLRTEIPHWDFDSVKRQAAETWSNALASIEGNFSDPAISETFYTGAYHGLIAPVTYNDVDGNYRGQDGQNHIGGKFTKYTTLSIWDIYRGEFPFITLTQPQRVNDIIQTMVMDYQQLGQHALPVWPLWGNETWSMGGFHAAGMILGAYIRGFRDFDIETAYAAIRDTALVGAETRGNRELQAWFRKFGYVPADMHGGSVSCTLDLAYDYWCGGAMAELLGKKEDSEMFYKLSRNYRNIFNPNVGFMQPKLKDAKWREPFHPDEETDDYVETDPWQAGFSVPHDVQGLIELHGGDDSFLTKLEGLFTAPSLVIHARPDVTGMVGQDAQGNEPSNHIPYLFTFAGAPWKTQYWVRKVASLYNNTPNGVPGNDDCGQLSSWFALTALGFYPVNAANGVYVIGSPMIDRGVIHNSITGTRFLITTENNSAQNVYIQEARLNGKELTRSWLSHAELASAGELHFRMGSHPNKEWGADKAARPPSGLIRT